MKHFLSRIGLAFLMAAVAYVAVVSSPASVVNGGNCTTTNSCNLLDASDFAQYCSANSATCNKVNQNGTSGSASCPNETQTISAVYVHAGGGQTVTLLPNSGYIETFSNNNATVTVQVNGTGPSHPNLSWIGVLCSTPITPSPTVDPCANNACVTPTVTPVDPCANNACVTPTVTTDPTPTATPTPSVSDTPTPTSTTTSNGGGDGQSDGLGCAQHDCSTHATSSTPEQAVLGASTMAGTGTFENTLMNVLFALGMMVLGGATLSYAKEKNK